ncbi:ribosomal-protein-alanine N-acetyltransferase [Acetobacter estunensis]|uniref:Ribosomal-protein-alanine N-acetyltransferase n=1 Tax=Acetobacter estunensis TaxID=104097 RepID=A0A967B8C4_9PROT|nr:ribosomal protein S18-alanine N-acetyltransferase [Acetobacter estunensis]NHO54229.1 ribosomal-protein-alanine N-acetyltransferase [Acetobacter estunensis]
MTDFPCERLSITEVGEAFSSVLAVLHERAFPVKERWNAEAFENLLRSSGVSAFLACHAEMPVGFVLVRSVLDEAEILTLAVDPAFQRKGVGRAVLGKLFHVLREQEIIRVFLEVSVRNGAARALYAATGLVTMGLRRRYYPDGSDAEVMAAEITPML